MLQILPSALQYHSPLERWCLVFVLIQSILVTGRFSSSTNLKSPGEQRLSAEVILRNNGKSGFAIEHHIHEFIS